MASVFAFNDSLSDAVRWSTRSAAVSGSGTTTAAFPVTNIFTENAGVYWERTGIASTGTVTLDLTLASAVAPAPPLNNRSILWGFLNVQAFQESTGSAIDVALRLRESTVAFTGPYNVDQQRDVRLANLSGASVRQIWMPRLGATSEPINSPQLRPQGGIVPRGFNRIEFTAAPGSNWTLRVGRVALMSGLVCTVSPQPTRGGSDQSEVVRSFSGRPYVFKKDRLRRHAGTLIGLTNNEVHGNLEFTVQQYASVFSIVQLAGLSQEVCVIEDIGAPASSSVWQQQPVWGLLQSDLQARQQSSAAGGGISSCDFEIVETPLA
jgi:hypothetical protein